jgi:nucleotide-binding universal stress UspA family protein
MYAKILVPVDGSVTSNLGLDEAIRIAKSQGSQIRLVHVVNEYVLGYPYAPGVFAGSVIDELKDAGSKILTDTEASVRQQGVACESVLLECLGGAAASSILDQAKEWPADIIVMGTHGRRGLVRLTLGSDAEHVVRMSPVPVLLVRNAAQRQKNVTGAQHADARAA